MIYVTKQNFHVPERSIIYSAIMGIALTCIVGFYYIIVALSYSYPSIALEVVQESYYKAGLFPYPMGSYVLFFIPMILVAIGLYVYRERKKKDFIILPRIKNSNSIDLELSRKVFHIGLIAILVCYICLGEMVITNIYNHLNVIYSFEQFPGNFIPYYNFNLDSFTPYMGKIMLIFAFMNLFFFLILTDFIRIYEPKYYLLKTISKSWKECEEKTFGPHVYLTLGCMIPALFFSPPIAAAAIGIASLGDGTATIIGITKGSHKIKESSNKTWEGCIGGFLGAFFFGLLCYIAMIYLFNLYGSFYEGSILEGVVICLIGALIFFMIDYLNPPISDNLLNPVVCGLVMFCISLFFR